MPTTAQSVFLVSFVLFASSSALREYESGKSARFKHCDFLDGVYTAVMRRIFNAGFHKELSSDIEIMLTTSLLPPKCRIVVEETVPRGFYVDVDQLRGLDLKTFTAAEVDVEKPEFEAEAFRLYAFRDLDTQENLRLTSVLLPVHSRYHRPRELTPEERKRGDSPTQTVKMQNPRLLLSCEGDDVAEKCPDRAVTTFCDSTGLTKCEYLQIPYKVNVNAVEVSVPVGNSDHAEFVVGVTTLIVSGGTIYLLGALARKVEPAPFDTF